MNTFGRSMGAERREEAAHETQISSSSYIIIFFSFAGNSLELWAPNYVSGREREGDRRAEKETNDVSAAAERRSESRLSPRQTTTANNYDWIFIEVD